MNNYLVHIGFGNMVNAAHINVIVTPDSAPVRRLVQSAREEGILVDASAGKKTKSVLVMDNGQVVLSALLPETIAGRNNSHTASVGGEEGL